MEQNIELTVGERLTALGMLPQEGSIVTLRLMRDLAAKLGLSADEHKEFEVVIEGEKVSWKNDKAKPFALKEKEKDLLSDALKKLDESKKLGARHISLWEKIVEVK